MLSKILASMAIIFSLLGSGIYSDDEIMAMSVESFIGQYSDMAETLAPIYLDNARRYGVPVDILVRQGAVESRYDVMAVGDGGDSVGLHQIKWGYHQHERLLMACDDGRMGQWMRRNAYDVRELFFRPALNVEVAAMKLGRQIKKYQSIELALVAYGCGQNSMWFERCKKDPSQCYRLRHVRQVMGTEKIK